MRKNGSLESAGLVTLIIVSLIAIPTFLSGKGAEDIVEHLPEVSKTLSNEHEELAITSLWLMLITGLIALFTIILMIKNSKRKPFLSYLTYLLAIGTFVLMINVGNDGGKIRHTELRENSVSTSHEEDEETNDYEEEEYEENDDY